MSGDEPFVIGDWVKQRVLGSGGFGVVTLWKHKGEDRMIALKKCHWGTDLILTPKHKERWSKEVEIMLRLSHPNVVQAVSVPSDLAEVLRSELPMLCMEFCSKGDLRQVLNRSENCCGLLEPDVRALISDIAGAVKYLHYMKITHRDLKPENIVLKQGEQRVMYKLIDLGYAKELDQSSICTSFVGTLQYLAPELFMSKTYNCSVDYWSLGLVAHEVITGVRPFLPNMAPVLWMKHVSGKSSDDICAYQAQDGCIVFSKELFPQNHISSCLKYYMEHWLKMCLEWDPEKRGRDLNQQMDGDIAVFNVIENILMKTILNAYDSLNYQTLSYEIEISTAVSTLQGWIERDTGLLIHDQELLLADGTNVDLEKEAWQCLSSNTSLKDPHVFVYRKGVLIVPEVKPQIPAAVSAMMQEPRSLLDYAQQIRAYTHAVFFLNQEQDLNRTFRQAIVLKLMQLSKSSNVLVQEIESVVSRLHQVNAQYQFNEDALKFDQQKALKSALVPGEVVRHWEMGCITIKQQMDKLKEVTQHLQSKCKSILRKTQELEHNSHLGNMDRETLSFLVDAGRKCYENLRRRPKEKRNQKVDSVEMVKIVYNCLKTRDKLLRDLSFNTYLRQIVTLQADVDKLCRPLSACAKTIQQMQGDLAQVFRDRQLDIWTHFEQISSQIIAMSNVKLTNKNQPHKPESPPQSHVPALSISTHKLAYSPPLATAPIPRKDVPALFVPAALHTMPNDIQHISFQEQVDETNDMIYDNIALRYATQDLMNQSFQHYCSILNDDRSLDWTFMSTS